MDTRALVIALLVSILLVVGAVIALWWRNRKQNGAAFQGGADSPPMSAPAPARQKSAKARPADASSGETERPSALPPQQAAPGSFPTSTTPVGGSSAADDHSSAEITRRSAPVSSPPPAPPAPPPPPPMSQPRPAEPSSPAKPLPKPAVEEEETEASPVPDEGKPLPKAEPIPQLPRLDFDEMPAQELAEWMKNAAQAKTDNADESVTRAGIGSVDIGAFGKAVQTVLFSAYYPKEVAPEKWEPLHAYIFRAIASATVEKDAGERLGTRAGEFRGVRAPSKAAVPEGALVTATPHLAGFQFNPPSVSLGFYKDWHRFDFEARAQGAPVNQAANGLLTFTVEGIIVADIPLSIFVGAAAGASGAQVSAVARLYQSIFCSYSHQDAQIVARAERAYKALGLDYLRDVVSLKSGQEWSEELRSLINKADIFQLFWSRAAAQSEHVRYEWEHALQVAGWKENFIRPVYWQDPQPDIPTELKHIHFAYQPDLGQ